MNPRAKKYKIVTLCCLISLAIGSILGYAALSQGKDSTLWKFAYLIHIPVIIPAETFLSIIGKADAFPLIIFAVVMYWLAIGLAVAGITLKLRKKESYK